jgi:hypothetical protein
MYVQKIIYDRTALHNRLLAAACYLPDNLDDNLEQKRKRNNPNDLVDDSRIYCSYCRNKFDTDNQGPGIPRLTVGCKRDAKVGSRLHSANLRSWRKDDSNSNLKGISIGIEENYGCISCCSCTVCLEQLQLIEDQISNKKSKQASVQLPVEQHLVNYDDYNNHNDADNYIMDYIAIGEIGATEVDYLNAIYGPYKGPNMLLQLLSQSLYSLPRVYVSNDNDNEYEDDVTEVTTDWPENSNGCRSTIQFSGEQTDRYIITKFSVDFNYPFSVLNSFQIDI